MNNFNDVTFDERTTILVEKEEVVKEGVVLKIKSENGEVIAVDEQENRVGKVWTVNDPVCFNTSVTYAEDIEELIKSNKKLDFFATILETKEFIKRDTKIAALASLNLKEKTVELSKNELNALDSVIEEVVNKGFEKELVQDIVNNLLNYNVPSKLITQILKSFRFYPQHIQKRVPKKPETMFVDSKDLVLKGILSKVIGKSVLCKGNKGAGKNEYVKTLAYLFQKPLFEFSTNRETDKMDLIGGKALDNGKTYFEKEALIEAMECGGIYNLDEINFADSSVLGMLHSVLDDRKSLEVPGYGLVKAHKGFMVIATMNEGYYGTRELNEALNDRFNHLVFEDAKSIEKILSSKCPNVETEIIEACNKIYKAIRKSVEDETLDSSCVTIRGYIDACKMSEYLPIASALEICVTNKISDLDYREAVSMIVDDICSELPDDLQ